jgi:hypothetical protein
MTRLLPVIGLAYTAMFFSQLMPSSTYPLRQQLNQLVYPALVN